MDVLFGDGYGLRIFLALIVVLGLIGLTVWLVRRFGGERLNSANARGRQPRLAVIDAAAVDGRRRLILIRRDNVEHLLMIGGPSDIVVEANIIRAAAAQQARPATPELPVREPVATREPIIPTREPVPMREPAPVREPALHADAAPIRAPALGDEGLWPQPPEPIPAPSPRPRAPAMAAAEAPQWQPEPDLPSPPQRPRAAVDPLAGLAAELSRAAPQGGGDGTPPPRTIRERPAPRPERANTRERPAARMQPPPARPEQPAEPVGADQNNLSDVAHRLEAALRRPPKPEARIAPAAEHRPPAAPVSEPEEAPNRPRAAEASSEPGPELATAVAEARQAAEGRPSREARPAPQRSVYDSLEQEMASLLGRPGERA